MLKNYFVQRTPSETIGEVIVGLVNKLNETAGRRHRIVSIIPFNDGTAADVIIGSRNVPTIADADADADDQNDSL